MKWQEQREAFYRIAIANGLSRPDQLGQIFPLGYNVPQLKIDRWLGRLLEVPTEFASLRRYVNRFRLGADPEFIFSKHGLRSDATLFGLKQGLAFGADNNGRLAEIRPYPSRSALEVVASILATLKLLAFLQPKTLAYDWCSGAFLQDDGLGGHVHFGRKRPDRNLEIAALDVIEEELQVLGFYPADEVARRRQGDARRQVYGRPGDWRIQAHGYEYRTFPSWLDSPELAFVTLTISKLAVHNPELVKDIRHTGARDVRLRRILNLLSYYKDLDDDARLALVVMTRKLPVHVGGDFKGRWGIGALIGLDNPKIQVIPRDVKPSTFLVEEVFQYFLNSRPLSNGAMEITWQPSTIPAGYKMLITSLKTIGAKGLGEMVWDLCCHDACPLSFMSTGREGMGFGLPQNLANMLPVGWQKSLSVEPTIHQDSNCIYSNDLARERDGAVIKKFLTSGLFPLWRASAVKPDSYLQWKAQTRAEVGEKKKINFRDEVLFASEKIPGVKG